MSMYVITHKHFNYEKLPSGYMPLLVGADFNANPDHFLSDNTKDNISIKNPYYSELTGMYWIWKNTDDESVGISHYRRYFSTYSTYETLYKGRLTQRVKPISIKDLDNYLNYFDWVISTPKSVGNISLMQQFIECHYKQDIDTTREVIKHMYPEYTNDFDAIMSSSSASFYNMFYTSKRELDAYCTWLFNILFKVEEFTDVSNYDTYQKRLYGFLSERLLNVWLHHQNVKIKYLAEYNSERLNRKTALKKLIIHFIKSKPLLYSMCKRIKQ